MRSRCWQGCLPRWSIGYIGGGGGRLDGEGFRLVNRIQLAPPVQLATAQVEQKAARHKAGKHPHRLIGGAWNDHALSLLEAVIGISRHSLGRTREQPRKDI